MILRVVIELCRYSTIFVYFERAIDLSDALLAKRTNVIIRVGFLRAITINGVTPLCIFTTKSVMST